MLYSIDYNVIVSFIKQKRTLTRLKIKRDSKLYTGEPKNLGSVHKNIIIRSQRTMNKISFAKKNTGR